MMLAVVGQVEGSDPEAAVEAGADVVAGAGKEADGAETDGCAPGAVPALIPVTPGPRPATAEGIIGRGDDICPTACGNA